MTAIIRANGDDEDDGRPTPPPARSVLWSVTPELTGSPYIGELVPAIEARGWAVDRLTLRALAGRTPRIVHVQWPEHVSRGATPSRTVLKNLRALVMAAVLRLRPHQVVVTGHNLRPHGPSNRIDAWFRAALLRRADALVVLAPGQERELLGSGSRRDAPRIVAAPLPMLEVGAQAASERTGAGHLLMLGSIHPYHRIAEFVETLAAQGNTRPLIVAGSVADEALLERLRALQQDHDWLEVRPGFQRGAQLDELVRGAAAAVSLQRDPFNSGGAAFALPRGVPTAMTDGHQARHYIERVGAEWVHSVPEDLGRFALADLEAWIRMGRTTPDLSEFTLSRVANTHAELYKSLAQPMTTGQPALEEH